MGMMTVYHGGYQVVDKPEIRKGRNTKDFGTGFYCTIIKEQAQRWARRYDTKVVSIYDVCFREGLKIKEFKEMTEEWLDFIISCRSGQDHDYDIVIGAMTDDQIYNYGLYGWCDHARAVLDSCQIQISDTSDCVLYRCSIEVPEVSRL